MAALIFRNSTPATFTSLSRMKFSRQTSVGFHSTNLKFGAMPVRIMLNLRVEYLKTNRSSWKQMILSCERTTSMENMKTSIR